MDTGTTVFPAIVLREIDGSVGEGHFVFIREDLKMDGSVIDESILLQIKGSFLKQAMEFQSPVVYKE